jgi:transposase-like protein
MKIDFLPNVRCPHCKKALVVAISGFGREGYNVRDKECKYCGKEFMVEVVVQTTTSKETVADIVLASVKRQMKNLRKRRKEEAKGMNQKWN